MVLLNNDGCTISRCEKVKLLNIPIAVPVFKIKDIIRDNNIHLFSSNYTLYAEISMRVMAILEQFSPEVEVYSIDESFVRFKALADEETYLNWAKEIRQRIKQWVGIPVRVDIGPTKTLAKLANYWSKTKEEGIYYLDSYPTEILKRTPVDKIWGIGRRISKTLRENNIHTAYELIEAPGAWVRKTFNILPLKQQWSLEGIPVSNLRDVYQLKKIWLSQEVLETKLRNIIF